MLLEAAPGVPEIGLLVRAEGPGLIGDLAAKHRLPWVMAYSFLDETGALLSYGPDNRDVWQRLVRLVDKIL